MKTIKKNGRVYKRMILTYIIILCIPILLSVVLYRYTHNEIQKQSQEESDDLLKMIGSTCDREISYFKNVLQQLKLNSNVTQLVNSKTLDVAHRQWLAHLIAEDMTTMKSSMLDYSEFCKDLFLYLAEEDVIISVGSKTDFDTYCNFLMKMDQAKRELFKGRMLQLEHRLMVASQTENREYILLMEPIVSMTGKPLNAVVGLWIDPDIFEKQIRSDDWNQGREWAFIDSDGQYLHMTEHLKSESSDLLAQKNGQVMINGKRYQCQSLKSSAYNGEYLLFSSIQQTSRVASRVRSIYLCCVVVSVLLGYAVMRVSMKKNYMPLKRLINNLPKRDGEMAQDEFQYLEKRMQGMVEQYNDVKESAAKNKQAIREAAFQKLLIPARAKGQETEIGEKELFAKFKHGVNVVLIFCIRDEIQAEDRKNASEMEYSLKN
ncbi:MAG: cache domain-containing protein, partial [Lachnospiraceae bacterium]|nr:cache domain-containing protein [Lachnospiraceae bacterium]